MATQRTKKENLLYLDQITLQDIPNHRLTPRLLVENDERELQRKDNQTWALVQRTDVSPTSQLRVEIQTKRGHLPWATKERASNEIDLRELYDDYWTSKARELALQEVVAVGKHHVSIELQFSAEANAESLRASLQNLEELLEDYSPLMKESTEKALEKAFKFGAAFAELNDIAKAAFSVAEVAFELLQEQNKYDQMPAGLLDRLKRISFFADKVADEIVYEETEILEKTIPQMFEVMQRVAKYLCEYVRRGRFERVLGGLAHSEEIEEMDEELTKVIEDFDRAVNVEALRLAKKTRLTEQDLWLKERLDPVKASYDRELCCMEGTRGSILNRIITWVTNGAWQRDIDRTPYWIYGLPGIGKTSLAHSICEQLDARRQFAGAFFCRRDDTNSSKPRNILPTLIYQLARTSPLCRSIVTEHLHKNPHITPHSMQNTLFLDIISSIPCHSNPDTLVVVIDALDECGDTQSRADILKVLLDTAAQASWLKIIITSRPEVDIIRSLGTAAKYDLGTDQEAAADLRAFARRQLEMVASIWRLPTSWPAPQSL